MYGNPGADRRRSWRSSCRRKCHSNSGKWVSGGKRWTVEVEVVFESKDQRPSVPEEKEKIVRDGGFVKRTRWVGADGRHTRRLSGIDNAGIKYFIRRTGGFCS